MKVIKSHYNNHNQMCVWIESDRFAEYFEKIIVSYTLPNHERSELKIKTNKYVFFKFQVDSHKSEDLILALLDNNSNETYNLNDGNIQGWKNDGLDLLKPSPPDKLISKLINIPSKPGEYLCKYEFEDSCQKSLILVCWSIEYTQLEFIEE